MSDARDCEKIHDDLGGLLDGTLPAALAAHVADCDACRDLRHDLRTASQHVVDAGSDYVHAGDFDARLLAALDARTPATQATADAVVTAAPVPAPTAASHRAAGATRVTAQSVTSRWVAGALAALAAAAVLPFSLRAVRHHGLSHEVAVVRLAHLPARVWTAQVARVSRAAADPTGGIEVRAPGTETFAPIAQGAALIAGTEVRTDARTRARLDLADGTSLVLDRGTDLVLDGTHPRTARLVTGALVADVSHVDGATASIALPSGRVTVLGTRFALTASDDRATVRVTRGTVRLDDQTGHDVLVGTGQEGVVARGEVPSVAPAVDLAQSVAWSELGSEMRVEPEAPVVGLGELRARRPGQTDERDHAVHLASHAVRVRVVGNVARTEIDEVFRNDTATELEGIYRFPLPPEAQIEKLALDVHGTMQDGAFVDRQRAQAIWHGVLRNAQHAMTHAQKTDDLVWVPGPWRDPALLEWQRGGRFELRIFPIPAHGTRRVQIAYTQVIPASGGVRRYVYPLAHDTNGSTRVEQFDVDVQVMGHDPSRGVRTHGYVLTPSPDDAPAGATRLAFAQSGFVPAGDLVVEYALPDRDRPVTAWAYLPPADGVDCTRSPARVGCTGAAPSTGPAYVALALRPVLPRWTDTRPRDYALVVDASRSMVGERLARAARLARGMVAEMDPRDRVTVLACDTTCREMPGGLTYAGGPTVRTVEQFLAGEEAMGASDLVAQVRAATVALGAPVAARDARVVYLGDGAATAGWRTPEHVAAEIASVMPGGRASLTAVALGADADTTVLAAMARAGGGAMVPYAPGESLPAASLAVLEATYGVVLRDPRVELPAGLTDSAPARLGTLRAGSETLVVARMNAPEVRGDVVLRGTVGGEPFEARWPVVVHASSGAGNAFVPRLYAATKIAELESAPDGGAPARAQIVELSQRFHVASRFTSLLVLESEAMYRAFAVERNTGGGAAWTGDLAAEATLGGLVQGSPGTEPSLDDLGAGGGRASLATRATTATVDRAGAGPDENEDSSDPTVGPLASIGTVGHAPRRGRIAGDSNEAVPSGAGAASAGFMAARAVRSAPRIEAPVAPVSSPPVFGNGLHRPGGYWARREWVREATLAVGVGSGDVEAIDVARRALLTEPDSRGRHKELYRVLSLAGRFDEAAEVATRWSSRDALDPDALVRLADAAARRGERARAVRILAGVVDVRPEDPEGARRMARLHERAGQLAQACSYRIALAETRASDETAMADAVRCERTQGAEAGATRLLDAVTDAAARARVDTASRGPAATTEQTPRGEFVAAAVWDTPVDLDVALIDPRGTRVTWMGGRTSSLTARGATDSRSEGIGVGHVSTGTWVVEVSRSLTSSAPATVRGTVDLTVLGQRRTVAFTLLPTDTTARIARATVSRRAIFSTVDPMWR